MADYSDPYCRAKQLLAQSYNHAASGKLAQAIRLAWEAEAHAKAFAEALEAHRVERDREAAK